MKARHPLPLPPDMDCGFTAWTPSGVKREKHRAYNRLVSVIQRLCALCFSLLFFVLLKPKFSKEDYEKYLSDPELGIKYTNQRIVELLQIRKYEQEEMKQLIGETEAWERNKVSHIISTRKAYAPIKHDKRYAREMKEEADKEEFLQMRQLGMSNNQIAKKKHVDTRKVDRLIGKNTEREAERETLEQRVVEMTENGEFASKISKELGVSVSTVRRIRAKAQQ